MIQTLLLAPCGIGAYALRHHSTDLPPSYWLAIALGMLGFALVEPAFAGSRRLNLGRRLVLESARLALIAALLMALGYYLKVSEVYSRLWSAYWFGAALVALALVEMGRPWLPGASIACGRLLLVGPPAATSALKARLEASPGPLIVASMPVAEAVSWLERNQDAHDIDEVIVVGAPPSPADRTALVHALHGNSIDLRYCVDVGPGVLGEGPDSLAGLPTVSLLPPVPIGRVLAKRIEDVALGLVLLLPALPVIALTALAIRMEGRGPVLFRQRRLGFGGKSFMIYKFRTMLPAAALEPDATQAQAEDARITRIGRPLRRWGLDELPQLLNVLKGEMSLVGPRPHAFAHDVHYGAEIEDYAERLHMRPGITGLAQIKGCRGETPNVADMERRVELDLKYIRSWSPWLDLRILAGTLPALWRDIQARERS